MARVLSVSVSAAGGTPETVGTVRGGRARAFAPGSLAGWWGKQKGPWGRRGPPHPAPRKRPRPPPRPWRPPRPPPVPAPRRLAMSATLMLLSKERCRLSAMICPSWTPSCSPTPCTQAPIPPPLRCRRRRAIDPPDIRGKAREVLKGYRTIASDNELSSKDERCFISATPGCRVLRAFARALPALAPPGQPRIRRPSLRREAQWRAGLRRALRARGPLPRAAIRFPATGGGSRGSRRSGAGRARDRCWRRTGRRRTRRRRALPDGRRGRRAPDTAEDVGRSDGRRRRRDPTKIGRA